MNNSSIFNRNLFKEKIKEIYNNKYDFNNNILPSNIINKWKNNFVI